MSSDLRDRLEDLAAHSGAVVPPANLWERGVRRRRLNRAVTAGVAFVLVALVGLGGWTWDTTHPVPPAATHGSPRLPDRLFAPSPWLPAFDGPPGRLVAIGVADKKSLFHTDQAVYGVTASGSAYGFLDLPGFVDEVEVNSGAGAAVLAPDGRALGYWSSGEPSGSVTARERPSITGVSVYDAQTGRTRTVRFSTRHGLLPVGMAWSDSRTLVVGFHQLLGDDARDAGGIASRPAEVRVWRLEDGDRAHELPGADRLDPSSLAPGHGFVASQTGDRLTLVWPRQPGRVESFSAPPPPVDGPVVSPTGDRVAMVRGKNPGRLSWGTLLRPPRETPTRPATEAPYYYLPVAWTDESHVVALADRTQGHVVVNPAGRLDLVDVDTGTSRTLIDSVPAGGNVWRMSMATDLLTAPSAHAGAPPRPWDRRVVLQVLACLLVVGFFVWGSRVRRA